MRTVLIVLVVGEAVAMLALVRWQTDRRRLALERESTRLAAEAQQVRAELAVLTEAIAGLGLGVVVVDGRGRERLRNAAVSNMASDHGSRALVEDTVAVVLDAARRGQPAERQIDLAGPPRLVVEVTGHPLEDGAVAYLRDVSESRHLDRMRRDFVANVSHELKTPIGALTLLAETMVGEDDPDTVSRLAERALGEANRMARMVEELLDLSAIESLPDVERAAVLASELIERAAERVREAADASGVVLRVAPVPEGLAVACEARLVVSALFNLLDNAVKYSDAGGSVEASARQEADDVVFEVSDHGIGIPARDRERIFERFYRVDRARSRATGGTGLGLAIVRHVAEAHRGSISVQSREGHGSTFALRLPARRAG